MWVLWPWCLNEICRVYRGEKLWQLAHIQIQNRAGPNSHPNMLTMTPARCPIICRCALHAVELVLPWQWAAAACPPRVRALPSPEWMWGSTRALAELHSELSTHPHRPPSASPFCSRACMPPWSWPPLPIEQSSMAASIAWSHPAPFASFTAVWPCASVTGRSYWLSRPNVGKPAATAPRASAAAHHQAIGAQLSPSHCQAWAWPATVEPAWPLAAAGSRQAEPASSPSAFTVTRHASHSLSIQFAWTGGRRRPGGSMTCGSRPTSFGAWIYRFFFYLVKSISHIW
jgi:hypothetical protein